MRRINSQEQYVFEFNGIYDIEENAQKYFDVMKNFGIICFRRAFLDSEKSVDVLFELSKYFNWTPVYKNPGDSRRSHWIYTQNYDDRALAFNLDGSEQGLINPWHLEGMYKKNTMHAAGWNMRNFKCHKSVGQTGFVDASVLIQIMPKDMYEFMKRSKLIHYPIFVRKFPDDHKAMVNKFTKSVKNMEDEIWTIDGNSEISSHAHDAIEDHPTFGCEVLRLCPCRERWGNQHLLFSVDGRQPTDEENKMFDDICQWLSTKLLDESIVWYHEYEEGDLIIPDLFIMIHAARGGFDSGQREFDGFWCYQKNVDYEINKVREIA